MFTLPLQMCSAFDVLNLESSSCYIRRDLFRKSEKQLQVHQTINRWISLVDIV